MPLPRRLVLASTVVAVTAALAVTADGVAYAATGSSLLLGRNNSADALTTVSSSASGPALRLVTSASSAAPFSTNARGKVVGLDADRLDGLDAVAILSRARTDVDAARLGGRTAEQIAASVPVPRFSFVRTDIVQTANPGAYPGALSAAGAWPGTYRLSGSVTTPCTTGSTSGHLVSVVRVQSALESVMVVRDLAVPAASCGLPVPISATTAMTATSRLLVVVHDIDAGGPTTAAISFALAGVPTTSRL